MPAKYLAWQPNAAFLRQQMEKRVPRFEYRLTDGFSSVDELARVRRETFSAFEINYMDQNAAAFGYERVGNYWIYGGE
ncbi:hypothetical protein [Mycolicibacter icosiumassiliensis]|uniref:hypothetical protein n=1 Tax=Mycolicibacter icosiumassiliensis TaxID=1792835 RepID=UPI000B16F7FD|nr:hypothetical protein [Mycolicibacter icosiumassiliensis]